MDIDMDIDMEDPDIVRLRAQAEAINAQHLSAQNQGQADSMNGIQHAPEEGEVDPEGVVRHKIHIRGLDNLSTASIEAAIEEHCDMTLYSKIQWIDDTSANLVFDTEDAAVSAIEALSETAESDELQLRNVRALHSLPDTQLQARFATESDVKVKGAKDRSRFYLMNPEYDPETRTRKRRYDDRGGRGSRSYGHGKRQRMDLPTTYSDADDRVARRTSAQSTPFNEDLYDDVLKARPASHDSARDSVASSDAHGRKLRKYDDQDLLASTQSGRLRDRSASPAKEGDGRYGFSESQPYRQTARHRSRSPLQQHRSRDISNRHALDTRRKELFPTRPSSSPAPALSTPDLFDRTANSSRELFPEKALHKRQDARVVPHDELATAIGKYSLHEAETSGTYIDSGPARAAGRLARDEKSKPGRDLFARINGEGGRLREDDSVGSEGFNFKGAGAMNADGQDFSIRGASGLARELFPVKAGKEKPDLFEGRLNGRGSQRRRAEDLF